MPGDSNSKPGAPPATSISPSWLAPTTAAQTFDKTLSSVHLPPPGSSDSLSAFGRIPLADHTNIYQTPQSIQRSVSTGGIPRGHALKGENNRKEIDLNSMGDDLSFVEVPWQNAWPHTSSNLLISPSESPAMVNSSDFGGSNNNAIRQYSAATPTRFDRPASTPPLPELLRDHTYTAPSATLIGNPSSLTFNISENPQQDGRNRAYPLRDSHNPRRDSTNSNHNSNHNSTLNLAPAQQSNLVEIPAPNDMPVINDDGTKPPYSYAALIGMAILRAPGRKLTLSQIYNWIITSFEWYRKSKPTWHNSIRHNLSLNKAFVKQERPKDDAGKGNYWTIQSGYEAQFLKPKAPKSSTNLLAAASSHSSSVSVSSSNSVSVDSLSGVNRSHVGSPILGLHQTSQLPPAKSERRPSRPRSQPSVPPKNSNTKPKDTIDNYDLHATPDLRIPQIRLRFSHHSQPQSSDSNHSDAGSSHFSQSSQSNRSDNLLDDPQKSNMPHSAHSVSNPKLHSINSQEGPLAIKETSSQQESTDDEPLPSSSPQEPISVESRRARATSNENIGGSPRSTLGKRQPLAEVPALHPPKFIASSGSSTGETTASSSPVALQSHRAVVRRMTMPPTLLQPLEVPISFSSDLGSPGKVSEPSDSSHRFSSGKTLPSSALGVGSILGADTSPSDHPHASTNISLGHALDTTPRSVLTPIRRVFDTPIRDQTSAFSPMKEDIWSGSPRRR